MARSRPSPRSGCSWQRPRAAPGNSTVHCVHLHLFNQLFTAALYATCKRQRHHEAKWLGREPGAPWFSPLEEPGSVEWLELGEQGDSWGAPRPGREAQGGGARGGGSRLVSPPPGPHGEGAAAGPRRAPRPAAHGASSRRGPPEVCTAGRAGRRGGRGPGAPRWGAAVPPNRAGCHPRSPGNLLSDVMRRRGNTCAPGRAALAQLRVANGVNWGRGREEVEAPESRKCCVRVPPIFGGWGDTGLAGRAARTSECPRHSWRSGVRSPRGRGPSGPKCPRAPLDARDRVARSERTEPRRRRGEKPRRARGLVGGGAGAARTPSAARFKEPHFWEGTGNCQSSREGAHRRRVMSADQLLTNKEGLLQEKVAAAADAAAPRGLGGEGQVGDGRRGGGGGGG